MRTDLFWKSSLFAISVGGFVYANVTISGRVVEKGTRLPIEKINVYVLPHKLRVETSSDGSFSVEVPEGEFSWVVNAAGYKKLEKTDKADAGTNKPRTLYLEKQSYQVYETTIYGQEEKRDERTKSLKASEFSQMPGSGGDPLKAVQNLPGIARTLGFSSNVIIEGSAPQDTTFTLDGVEVPQVFHFGGLTSVFFPESLDRVEYLPAGFGPEYGRALAGYIGVWTRDGRTDQFHGLGFTDLFQAGALADGPVGNGSYMIGARQSYFGAVLGLVAKNNANFDFTVAPAYTDGIGIYSNKFGDRDKFRLVLGGSNDRLGFLVSNPTGKDGSQRGTFDYNTMFYRLIPEWQHELGPNLTARFTLGLGWDDLKVDASSTAENIYYEVSYWGIDPRLELEYRESSVWKSYWGLDDQHEWIKYQFQVPSASFSGEGRPAASPSVTGQLHSQATPTFHSVGFYWRNVIEPENSPWTFIPGIRFDYYNVTSEMLPSPRCAAKYRLTDSLSLRGGAGYYTQPPQGQEIDPTLGNPDLKAERAYHFVLGVEKDFREGRAEGFVLTTDAFFKGMDHLVESTNAYVSRNGTLVPMRYANTELGKAYGVELGVKLNSKPWTGYLSYTLSRSTRWDAGTPEHLFQYDQTHILNVMASLETSRNWTFSARFRIVSGDPYTPVTGGIFDDDTSSYRPVYGADYSDRFPAFVQLDVRIDKKWIFNDWILSAYLDVQNVTNRQNVEAVRYSYDFSKSEFVTGLPILPTIGVKGEF